MNAFRISHWGLFLFPDEPPYENCEFDYVRGVTLKYDYDLPMRYGPHYIGKPQKFKLLERSHG